MAVVDWFFDGNAFKRGSARFVATRTGWDNVNPFQGQNVAVPNRSGELYVPKKLGAGALALNVFLYGNTDQKISNEWDNLLRMVAKPHRLITIEKRLPNQEVRFCEAELSGGIQPTTVGRHGTRAQLQFRIPSGRWRSQRTFTYQSTTGQALPQSLNMPDIGDSTAPIDDARIIINGPITNPTIATGVGGVENQLKYNGTVPAGAQLIINSGLWSIRGVGFTANPAALETTANRLLTINPGVANPALQLYGSGGDATTMFWVEVKSAYLA